MATPLVIFDCDGVLVDSEPLANAVFASHLQHLGVELSEAECLTLFRGRSLASCEQLLQRMGIRLPVDFFASLQAETFARFEAELQPVAGVQAVLASLTLPFCIASSGHYDKLRVSLTATGLGRYFNGRVYSVVSVPRGKPFPDLFLYACQQMGGVPAQSLVIEDSPVGIEAALAAGMTALWFDPQRQFEHHKLPAWRFQQMAELPGLIEKWRAGLDNSDHVTE